MFLTSIGLPCTQKVKYIVEVGVEFVDVIFGAAFVVVGLVRCDDPLIPDDQWNLW